MMRLADKLFGTILQIDLYETNIQYKRDLVQMFSDIARLHTKFTIFDKSSEVMRLNRGEDFVPCKEVIQLISFALDYYQSTNHYFNPCGYGLKKGLSNQVGNPDLIKLSDYRINLNQQAIDLGGIAKGYALDYLKTYCEFNRIENILVNFGGAIYMRGNYPGNVGFNLGIRHPKKPNENICVINNISNCIVNTSVNDDQVIVKDGKQYGHIFNQGQLIACDEALESVSLIGTNGAKLDAYATAIVAMGLEQGLEFVKAQSDINYVIIGQQKIYTNLQSKMLNVCDKEYQMEEIYAENSK